jgi:hypothetical protein
MIFQTAVRKYLDMHEKSKSGFFLVTDIRNKIRENFEKKCGKFS